MEANKNRIQQQNGIQHKKELTVKKTQQQNKPNNKTDSVRQEGINMRPPIRTCRLQ